MINNVVMFQCHICIFVALMGEGGIHTAGMIGTMKHKLLTQYTILVKESFRILMKLSPIYQCGEVFLHW